MVNVEWLNLEGFCRTLLLLVIIVGGGCGGIARPPTQPASSENPAIRTSATKLHARAVAFMLSRQNQDGSFGQSETARMRTAKTGLVLYTLALPGASATLTGQAIAAAKQKALTWLLKQQNPDGSFGTDNEKIFATIMGIKALLEIVPQKHNRAIRRARAYLRNRHEYFAYIAQDSPKADLASCRMAWTKAAISPGAVARIYLDTVLPGIASASNAWCDLTLKLLAQRLEDLKDKNHAPGFSTTTDNPLQSDPVVCAALVARSAALIRLWAQKGWTRPVDSTKFQRLEQ